MKVWKPLFLRIKSEFLSMEFKVFSKKNFSLSFIIVVCHPVDWLIDWYISNCLRSTSLGNRLWDGDVHEESYWEVKEVRLGRRWRRYCHNKVLELGWPFRMAPSWGKGVRLHIPTLHPTLSSYVCGLPMERWFFLRANPREPSPTHLPAAGGMNASILEGIWVAHHSIHFIPCIHALIHFVPYPGIFYPQSLHTETYHFLEAKLKMPPPPWSFSILPC